MRVVADGRAVVSKMEFGARGEAVQCNPPGSRLTATLNRVPSVWMDGYDTLVVFGETILIAYL
jgi:hypothetical protein